MAHNINITEKGAAFFSRKEKPWHGLGQIVEKAATSEEAIRLAMLDYEIEKHPNFAQYKDKEGKFHILETKSFSTVRTDTCKVLGDKLGRSYHVIQNRDAFQFFDAIVGEGEAMYETAGALGDGETVFITAKLPDFIKVGKEDIEKYLLLTMSHDGSGAVQAMFTPVRVVCNNTLSQALRGAANKVKIRHTTNASENLKKAHEVLGISNRLANELKEVFSGFVKTKVSDKQVKEFVEQCFLSESELRGLKDATKELSKRRLNQIEDVLAYYHSGPGQGTATTEGTLFGAYNAVTGYFSNVKEYGDPSDRMKNNLLSGFGQATMQKAMDIALEIIR